jgi:hypothetical protein
MLKRRSSFEGEHKGTDAQINEENKALKRSCSGISRLSTVDPAMPMMRKSFHPTGISEQRIFYTSIGFLGVKSDSADGSIIILAVERLLQQEPTAMHWNQRR